MSGTGSPFTKWECSREQACFFFSFFFFKDDYFLEVRYPAAIYGNQARSQVFQNTDNVTVISYCIYYSILYSSG